MNVKQGVCLMVCGCMLSGCITTSSNALYRGEGTVRSVEEIKHRDYTPDKATHQGAKLGGTAGGVAGVVTGASVGAVAGMFSGCIEGVAVGALVGSVALGAVGAGAGAFLGGTSGYAVDVAKHHAPVCLLEIKPLHSPEVLYVRQTSACLPVGTKVRIFEKNDQVFIKKYA